jgi:hypothetical protein
MKKDAIHEMSELIHSFNERLAQQMPLPEDEIERLISSGNTDKKYRTGDPCGRP